MTTVVYKDGKMVCDGQVTAHECLILTENFVKIRNIGGALVGGAGNGFSIVKFFQWFEDKVVAEWAGMDYPTANILPPEDLFEKDFEAIVVTPDREVFIYAGTGSVLPMAKDEHISVGSGSLYAYPLLDAGFTAKQAVEGAIKRDPFSGGMISEIELQEVNDYTEEDIREMSHEDLLKYVLGSDEEKEDGTLDEEPVNVGFGFDGDYVFLGEYTFNIHTSTKDTLKSIADTLKVRYPKNISEEKLRQKIIDFFEET